MMSVDVLFELEAGPEYGMGHLGRCRVIADALAAQGNTVAFRIFGMPPPPDLGPHVLATEDTAARILVLDRYHATPERIAMLRARHGVLVVIDDHAQRPVAADIVVNGNYYGETLSYAAYPARKVLAGPRYAPVAPGFREAAKRRPPPGTLLITFGLSDVAGLLLDIAPGIAAAFPDLAITTILPERFLTAAGQQSHPENLAFIPPCSLAERLCEAEIVLCGLGVTWQEVVVAQRRPVGVRLVANQDLMLACLERAGLPCASAPDISRIVAALVAERAAGSRPWLPVFDRLDGLGPSRIASAMADALCASRA